MCVFVTCRASGDLHNSPRSYAADETKMRQGYPGDGRRSEDSLLGPFVPRASARSLASPSVHLGDELLSTLRNAAASAIAVYRCIYAQQPSPRSTEPA